MSKNVENEPPVMGIPYNASYQQAAPPPPTITTTTQPYPHPHPQHHQYNNNNNNNNNQYYVGQNPYQAGAIPPNAVVGDPKGIPIQQTIYRDSPAPFNCVFCGNSGLTTVRSKPSLAAVIGCMMPMMLGICFLCPSMDCLWHKYHYCPSCNEKVADYRKSDPCAVMDPPRWVQQSFALPA